MKKNQIGKSDLFISELTLGCMSLGTDEKQANRIIDAALDAGINHLDTADLYDFGENEKLLGQVVKQKRNSLIITSKVGNHFEKAKKDWFWDPSKTHIIAGLKDSLRRLGTDYIDLYLLHGGTMDDAYEETIEAFESLKQEGLIRAYGISSIRPNVIKRYVEHASIDAVMMQYSILDRRPEEEILDLLHDNQISVLARGPLAKGLLSSKAEQQLERKAADGYLAYELDQLKEMVHSLQQLCPEKMTMNELALRYVLKHPSIASAVFGASSELQVMENISAANIEQITNELYAKIQQISRPIRYEAHR
ncbi:aldo/keto reductase [Ornithinibacillus gellani]|uniref:aldo/keto reductase n=1 Tax=Ornithinibacillus gellani TaxID=2293253 RepID=UPI000F4A7D31|nr:aldo/keto reductase [Ornithinibacillus gellani]TQS74480.1 aldo/keto reductase [Ornithinibacillus gellani]